jgi:spore maturation protein A
MKVLFPGLKKEDKAYEEISMNMVANIMGLGNAATPLGLKAMKTMQKENPKKDTLSDSMLMFIVVNTASIQIIPTTVIAVRNSLGSENPTEILLPVWIATIAAFISAITVARILIKKK